LIASDVDGAVALVGNVCTGCGSVYFPARQTCARCFTAQFLEPHRLSRQGEVYTYTVVYQSTPEFETPYVLAYVDFPENVRVLAQVVGVAPEAMRLRLPVEAVATDRTVQGFAFQPAEGSVAQ
jgi:uncharacterized OB-fold protein